MRLTGIVAPADGALRAEKWVYAKSPRPVQWVARQVYTVALLAALTAAGRNPIAHVRSLSAERECGRF
jgi:hypothetical protein